MKQQIYAILIIRLIMLKLKQDLKYRGYLCFELVRPNVLYQALNYFKTRNSYSGRDEHQDVAESFHKKIFQPKQNMVQLRIH